MVCTLKLFYLSSSSKLIIPITSSSAVDSAIFSSLVVLSVIRYFILLVYIIRQLSYITVREWPDNRLSYDCCCHVLAQSVSTYHYNPFIFLALKWCLVLLSLINTCIYVLRLLRDLLMGHFKIWRIVALPWQCIVVSQTGCSTSILQRIYNSILFDWFTIWVFVKDSIF